MTPREIEIERRTKIWRRALEGSNDRHTGALRNLRDTVRQRLREDESRRG